MAASCVISSNSYTQVYASMTGLSHPVGEYQFAFYLYYWNGSAWVNTQQSPNTSPYYSRTNWAQFVTPPGYNYHVIGWAKWDTEGVWYQFTSGDVTLSNFPATFSGESTQKTTITFTYSNTVGAMTLYVDIWNGSAWVWTPITSAGFLWSKVGNQITITNLIPNTPYYFYVGTVLDGYTSNTAMKTYTTQAWPTIPAAVTISGRQEGGYYFNWGDHGYEGYSFGYCLRKDGSSNYVFTGHAGQGLYLGEWSVSHSFDVCASYTGYGQSGTIGWYLSFGWTSPNSYYTAPHYPTGVSNSITTKSFSLTATGMIGDGNTDVEWRWRVYGSGGGFSSSIDYAGGMSKFIDNLVHNTTYEIQVYGYWETSGLYSVGYYGINPATYLLTVGIPSGITVNQPSSTSYNVDLNYTWGSPASAMDFQWGTDGVNFAQFLNQGSTSVPKYTIDTLSIGNKYFQVRSRNTDGYNIVYSGWYTAYPYPINVVYNSRPTNWAWSPLIVQGGNMTINNSTKQFYITSATQWNDFCTRINLFRVYKGLGNYSFTSAVQYGAAASTQANQARAAILGCSPPTGLPSAVNSDSNITAAFFNGLKNSMNSIP